MSDAYQEIFSQSETGGILLQREGPEVFIVLDANPASQLAGNWRHLSLEELKGKNIADVFAEVGESGLLAKYNEALDGGRPISLGEHVYEDPDGFHPDPRQ